MMMLTAWVGQAVVVAVLLSMIVALIGIGLGFDISRRYGGHKPNRAPGDAAL